MRTIIKLKECPTPGQQAPPQHPQAPKQIHAALFETIPFRPLTTHTNPLIMAQTLEETKHIPLGKMSKKHQSLVGLSGHIDNRMIEITIEGVKELLHKEAIVEGVTDVTLYINVQHLAGIFNKTKNHKYQKY